MKRRFCTVQGNMWGTNTTCTHLDKATVTQVHWVTSAKESLVYRRYNKLQPLFTSYLYLNIVQVFEILERKKTQTLWL
jgi:hypothetical protein